MSKEEFEEFYKKHPDLDNGEYYAEFPDTNKSTIRSWKHQLMQPATPAAPSTPTKSADNSELEDEYIKLLTAQAKVDPKELEGLDNKSKILILKNKQKILSEKKPTTSGGSILPQPLPPSHTEKHRGIDKYIEFDKQRNEIRMQIPMEEIFDPEKNKELGLLK